MLVETASKKSFWFLVALIVGVLNPADCAGLNRGENTYVGVLGFANDWLLFRFYVLKTLCGCSSCKSGCCFVAVGLDKAEKNSRT